MPTGMAISPHLLPLPSLQRLVRLRPLVKTRLKRKLRWSSITTFVWTTLLMRVLRFMLSSMRKTTPSLSLFRLPVPILLLIPTTAPVVL
ncbi:MAG: DUF2929 family protein [Prevotella sp.]|nr:DUF2929 family protein [Prevotella sp.]